MLGVSRGTDVMGRSKAHQPHVRRHKGGADFIGRGNERTRRFNDTTVFSVTEHKPPPTEGGVEEEDQACPWPATNGGGVDVNAALTCRREAELAP